MAEEQNHHDNVTLADILKEIKDMKDDAKVQHQHSLHFAAYLFSCAVVLAGIGFWVPLLSPLGWQGFNAVAFISLGMGSAIGLLTYQLLERRKRKARKGR